MYIGSVRFYKKLILLAVIILITVPTVFTVRLSASIREREAAMTELGGEISRLEGELAETEQKLTELANQTDGAPAALAAADAAPEAISYQKLYPDFYAPEPYHATQRETGTVFLTFDDGPSKNTSRILEILAEEDVKATFFVTGRTNEKDLQRMRDIVAQGHTLGMHSYTHDYEKIYASVEAFLGDMYRVFTLIRETTGQTPTLFRFPGGSINGHNSGIYQELIAEMVRRGFVPYDWNMSAADTADPIPSAEQIVRNVMRNADRVRRGFVLMHDSAARVTTAEAVEDVIKELREKGFRFDRITPETQPVLFDYRD